MFLCLEGVILFTLLGSVEMTLFDVTSPHPTFFLTKTFKTRHKLNIYLGYTKIRVTKFETHWNTPLIWRKTKNFPKTKPKHTSAPKNWEPEHPLPKKMEKKKKNKTHIITIPDINKIGKMKNSNLMGKLPSTGEKRKINQKSKQKHKSRC